MSVPFAGDHFDILGYDIRFHPEEDVQGMIVRIKTFDCAFSLFDPKHEHPEETKGRLGSEIVVRFNEAKTLAEHVADGRYYSFVVLAKLLDKELKTDPRQYLRRSR